MMRLGPQPQPLVFPDGHVHDMRVRTEELNAIGSLFLISPNPCYCLLRCTDRFRCPLAEAGISLDPGSRYLVFGALCPLLQHPFQAISAAWISNCGDAVCHP